MGVNALIKARNWLSQRRGGAEWGRLRRDHEPGGRASRKRDRRCNPAGVAPAHPTRTPASRDTKTCQRSVDGTKRLTRRSRMSRCHHGVKISHGGTENTEVSRASAGERGRSPLPFVDATPSTRRGRVALQLIGIVGREHRGAFSCFDERLERLSCPAKRAFVSVGAAYPAGART